MAQFGQGLGQRAHNIGKSSGFGKGHALGSGKDDVHGPPGSRGLEATKQVAGTVRLLKSKWAKCKWRNFKWRKETGLIWARPINRSWGRPSSLTAAQWRKSWTRWATSRERWWSKSGRAKAPLLMCWPCGRDS